MSIAAELREIAEWVSRVYLDKFRSGRLTQLADQVEKLEAPDEGDSDAAA